MTKKAIGPVLLSLSSLLTLLSSACVSHPGIKAEPGEEFTLAPGQSATILGEDLAIAFIEVISDSRCPEGAICIWEGEASCLVEIEYHNSVSSKVLVQRGIPGASQDEFNDYIITFDLLPYPEVGGETKQDDYRLNMLISGRP